MAHVGVVQTYMVMSDREREAAIQNCSLKSVTDLKPTLRKLAQQQLRARPLQTRNGSAYEPVGVGGRSVAGPQAGFTHALRRKFVSLVLCAYVPAESELHHLCEYDIVMV